MEAEGPHGGLVCAQRAMTRRYIAFDRLVLSLQAFRPLVSTRRSTWNLKPPKTTGAEEPMAYDVWPAPGTQRGHDALPHAADRSTGMLVVRADDLHAGR